MHNRKSIFCYLLATIAASVSGCDDLYWDSSLYDLYGKKDGTLNWCGTYDSDGQIVEKGDVVKLIKLVDNKRYEYTCREHSSDNTCTVMERKICDNDDINKECVESSLDDHKLSKEEKLYKTSFRNHACPTSFTCRSVVETTQNDSTKLPNDGNSDSTQNADNDANQSTNDEKQKSSNIFECIMAKCDKADIDLRSKTSCGGCNIDCSGDDVMCDDGRCIPRYKCKKGELACKCTPSKDGNGIECKKPSNGEVINDSELLCIDGSTDQFCGITKCEDFDGQEKCPKGRTCYTPTKAEGPANSEEKPRIVKDIKNAKCVCNDGTFEIDNNICVDPFSDDHCGIGNDKHNGSVKETGLKCSESEVCNGEDCVCASPYYACKNATGLVECKNLTEIDNCGACGNDCKKMGDGVKCVNSECVCPDGYIKCNDKCIDPQNDSTYCGAKDSCIGSLRGETCGTNLECSNGTCVCSEGFINVNVKDKDNPICIKIDTEPESEYSKYCGITKDNDSYQNCNKIHGGICSQVVFGNYICICKNKLGPIHETINGRQTLIACINGELNTNHNDSYCEYELSTNNYVNCNLLCDEAADTPHCNKNYSNTGEPWRCQNNKCVQGCGNTKTKCRRRSFNPKDNTFTTADGFICVPNNLLNPNDKYIKEDESICSCATCASTDANEICVNPIAPVDKGTNPDATVINSLNHCSKCYDSCTDKGLPRCAQTDPNDNNSYSCVCAEGEISIKYNEKTACVSADYSSLNLECQTKDSLTKCTCAPGYYDYDDDIKNGCELFVTNNAEYCGPGGTNTNIENCKKDISSKHTEFASCSSGNCIYHSCLQGFEDCNGKLNDGCETDLLSLNNCGKCYNKCKFSCYTLKECENKCATIKGSSLNACCVTGELSSRYNADQIRCCDGYSLYHYSFRAFHCSDISHYGCFTEAPAEDQDCWTEVTASK